MEQTLDAYLAAREALFRNPSAEAARAWWTSEGYSPPAHPTAPLATVHKARLQWLDATDNMLAKSRAFLFDHGYEAGLNICAYTSAGTPCGRNSALRRSRTANEPRVASKDRRPARGRRNARRLARQSTLPRWALIWRGR
jgi:hypothetical protein